MVTLRTVTMADLYFLCFVLEIVSFRKKNHAFRCSCGWMFTIHCYVKRTEYREICKVCYFFGKYIYIFYILVSIYVCILYYIDI